MKSLSTTLLTASLLLLPAASKVARSASGQGVRGPVMGYVFDENSRLLRPINGIPGAAHVAAAVVLDFSPAVVAVSPNQDFALAVDAEGRLRLVDLTAPASVSTVVEAAIAGADRIFISPSGMAAAIYDRGAGIVQVIDGLPAAASAAETFAVGSLPGVLTALAVSDNGAVLAAAAERTGGSLYALVAGRDPARIGTVRRVLGLSFAPRTDDAVAADYDASEVLLIRGVTTIGQISVIASANDGVSKPSFAAVAADGATAVAVVPSGVARVPLNGGSPELLDCACKPTTLSPLAGGAAFRLTEAVGAPIHLVEVTGETRMLFVPAAADAAQAALAPAAPSRAGVRARGSR